MDLHERQQFHMMLEIAVARWVERLEQRNEGAETALERLRKNPHGEGIWIDRYVEALIEDFLLNNADGSAFILRALPTRTLSPPPAGTVESMLAAMAHAALGELLRKKAEEQLEHTINFQALHSMA